MEKYFMNKTETGSFNCEKKLDISLEKFSKQINDIKESLDIFLLDKEYILESDDEDDDDYNEVWIKISS